MTEGVYYPTLYVTDSEGNVFSDTIAITVLSRAEVDTKLKGVWEKMKTALVEKDIETALTNFLGFSQERYRSIFTDLKEMLPSIVTGMQGIEMISVADNVAEYRIKRVEDGIEVTYFIYFAKDEDGLWKIQQF